MGDGDDVVRLKTRDIREKKEPENESDDSGLAFLVLLNESL